MSHFTVMVIGENPEEQLILFEEVYDDDGSELVKDVDYLEKEKGYYERDFKNKYPTFEDYIKICCADEYTVVPCGEIISEEDKRKRCGWARCDENGKIVELYVRKNPNAKWDWYSLGGRWSGYLILKSGECVDSALKKDIDFEEMAKSFEKYGYATFAYILNGEWHERGEMHWFGVAVNEKDKDVWQAQFEEMIQSLPDDTRLTVFDCHI